MTFLRLSSPTRPRHLALAAALVCAAASPLAQANTVYADNFAGGSTAGWTLPSYNSIASLPTDSGGLASANQAQWLKIDCKRSIDYVPCAKCAIVIGPHYPWRLGSH